MLNRPHEAEVRPRDAKRPGLQRNDAHDRKREEQRKHAVTPVPEPNPQFGVGEALASDARSDEQSRDGRSERPRQKRELEERIADGYPEADRDFPTRPGEAKGNQDLRYDASRR